MIASYYDRTFFANMYTGPTNDGVVPMNNSSWGTWVDSYGDTRAQMPLSASRQALDGRATKGGVDDYWRGYDNSDPDPFIGNWAEHSYGDSIGDYMRTNQSNYGNPDGSTSFYNWTTSPEPFTCSQMENFGIEDDGTVGIKNFYEARGYTVTDCYSQRTNLAGGFDFEDYKAEIDAGYPVMFHVYGHTMIGVGYDDTGRTMYIHDTWDYNTHTMTWNGAYANMAMYAVSIVHLQPQILGEGIHNDDAAEITYGPNWDTAANASHYDGDIHYSTTINNYANFKFAGGTFTIKYTGASDHGNMNVYVNDTFVAAINQYNSTTSYQSEWTSDEYPVGEHAVRLVHASGSKVDLDAIETESPCLTLTLGHTGNGADPVASPTKSATCDNPGEYHPLETITLTGNADPDSILWEWTGTDDDNSWENVNTLTMPFTNHSVSVFYYTPPGPGTYENTHGAVGDWGNWTTWTDARTSGGSTLYSNDEYAGASLWFNGTRASLIFTRYNTRGNIAISIDGETPVLVNQYGSSLTFQNRWDSPILEEGPHYIEITHPGGTHYIDFDAFVISRPDTVAPAAVSLSAATGTNTGQVDLNWNAPGDDGTTGTATSYIVRYATSAIDTQAKWDAATNVTGEPTPLTAGTAQSMTVSGLTPAQTYYFALRTLDEANNLSALSNSPSAAAQSPVPASPGTYENDDPNIVYTGNWTTWNIASASGGSTRYSNDPAATATLTFTGRQISLLYTGYSSRGIIKVTVDDEKPKYFDLNSSSLTFQNRIDSPLLPSGTHTVVLSHPGGTKYIDLDALIVSNPEAIPPAAVTLNAETGDNLGQIDLDWIAPGDDGNTGTATEYIVRYADSEIDSGAKWDAATDVTGEPTPLVAGTSQSMTVSGLTPGQTYYFALITVDEVHNMSDPSNSPSAVAQSPVPVSPGTYQNDDPNIAYTGNWTTWNDARTSGGSTRYSNDPAASATLTFSGRQVSLLFTRYTSRGNIEITIDGGTPVLLNQYGAALTFQNRWDSPLMDAGTHTVEFSHPGGTKYIDLDAIIISDPESTPPAFILLSADTGTNNGEIDLSWSAPGDDGNVGTAASYILRYAASAIDTEAKWDAATDVTGEPVPLVAGTNQTMTVSLIPGQTYYFAMRALDDSNNLSFLGNSPAAQAKAPTPVAPGTYQNTDANILYTGTWTNWNDARTSGGSTRYSNDSAASATLIFTGRQVSLLFTRYTSRGNIEITIDGGTPVLLNQYGSSLTFQNRWDSPLMAAGTHTVEFSHPGGTKYIDLDAIIISDPETNPPAAVTLSAATGSNNGQVNLNWNAPGDDDMTGTATSYIVRYAAAAIDSQAKWDAATDVTGEPTPLVAGTAQSMVVSGLVPGQTYFFALRALDDSNNLSALGNSPSAAAKSPTPVGVGTYENEDANIVYAGNWTVWNTASASGGSTRYSNDPAASASLTFTGRQVSLLFTRYTSRGNIEITIDGGTPVLLNQYGTALTFQNRWDSPLMDNGTHTVVLRHPGGSKYIDLDALIISDPESIPPSAVTLSAATGSSTGQVALDWNSPGDDGMVGTALSYTVRYATSAIDSQAKWDAATDVTGEPTPLFAGTHQSMTISGLTPGQTYFFALRSLDDSNNLSDLSNSPSAEAKPIVPVTEGLYQETDPNIRYTGNWQSWSDAAASGGSIKYSNDTSATAALTFTGEQIRLIFTRYTSRGDVVILIDDYTPLVFSQYGPSLVYQNWLTIYGLPAGDHTIQFRPPWWKPIYRH